MDSDTGSQQDIFATRVIGSLEDENLAGQKTSTKIKKNKKKKKEEKPGKKRAAVAMVYVVLIGLILGGLWLVYDFVVRDLVEALFAPKVTPVEVIRYVGRPVDEAVADLIMKNLPYVEPEYEYDDTIPKGIVISQKPAPGISILPGGLTKVQLVVSNGLEEVVIPEDIKFGDYLDVEIHLRDELKLKPREVAEYNDEVAQGRVIRTDPEMGTKVRVGSEVVIYKSLGPNFKDVSVPDLTIILSEEARHKLLASNLSIGRIFPEGRRLQGNDH